MISKSRDQVKSCDLSNHVTYFFSLSFDFLVTWSFQSHDFIESCDLSGHMASMSHVLFSHMLNSLLCFQTPTFGLLTNLQNMPHYIPLLLGSPIYCNTPAVSSRKVLYYINSISWMAAPRLEKLPALRLHLGEKLTGKGHVHLHSREK